jgi:hypothetical protein
MGSHRRGADDNMAYIARPLADLVCFCNHGGCGVWPLWTMQALPADV